MSLYQIGVLDLTVSRERANSDRTIRLKVDPAQNSNPGYVDQPFRLDEFLIHEDAERDAPGEDVCVPLCLRQF